jgi:hypothetical protein
MGNENYDAPWDFGPPSKWRDLAIFKKTDRVQSSHLGMQTELINHLGLYLSLYNM